jgi:hypothetical protein
MMPNPLPQPIHCGFVASMNDGDPKTETAWLLALGDAYYEVPVSQEAVNDRLITVRHIEAARQLEHLSYETGTGALIFDRRLCAFSSSKVDPKIADQLLMLALGHFDGQKDDPIGVVWKGKKHFISTTYNELEGAADYSDFMREPENEISVIGGEQYVYRTDWSFPHRKGATSWYLHDFTEVSKIIDRPHVNGRRTSNIARMKLTEKVPADIAESLFLHLRGEGSSLGFVSEVAMPDRRLTLPRDLSFVGEAVSSAKPDQAAGLMFVSSNLYYVPIEHQKDSQGQTIRTVARCDLLQKGDYWGQYDQTEKPFVEEKLKLHFDVSAEEMSAMAWAMHKLYAVRQACDVSVVERDPSSPIRLDFKRVAQMHAMHEGKKEFIGVVYKVGGDRWYVPLITTGDFHKDQFNADVAKAFRVSQTSDVVGRIKGDMYAGNISLSITKPSMNTIETLKFAIRHDYKKEIEAGKYLIG